LGILSLGDLLQPVTSEEHNFYQAAQLMHEEFKVDVDTVEITLRFVEVLSSDIHDFYLLNCSTKHVTG